MNKRTILRIGGGVLLAIFLWVGLPWLSPTRGVERAWVKLLDGIEGNDFKKVTVVVDSDYGDRWGFDKPGVVSILQVARRQFILCSIERLPHELVIVPEGRCATVRGIIRVEGTGSPVAQAIVQQSHQSQTPTTFEWVRRSWKPWDWKLVSLGNPDADAGMRRLQREIGKDRSGLGL